MADARQVRAEIETSWNELSDQIAALGPEGLTITGADGWAVKDHLIHLAAWELSLLALIEGRDRKAAMGVAGVDDDIDAINDAVWRLYRDDLPGLALQLFRESHGRLMAALEKLNDGDFERPYGDFESDDPDQGGPVMDWVAGDTYEHYAEHAGWIKELVAQRS